LGGRCSIKEKQKLFFKANWHIELTAFPESRAVEAAFSLSGERERVLFRSLLMPSD